tara:strand:- start:507 stop:1160 length:654 start_codon:yes stop_codon:yes gene_type:complete
MAKIHNELRETSDMQLFDERQNDLHRIEILSRQLTEPEHSHSFYEETKNEIEFLNKRIKQIDRIFESREWSKDLHRVMNEFKYLTRRKLSEKASKNALIVRIISTLLAQLSTSEIKKIIDKWQERLEARVRKQDQERAIAANNKRKRKKRREQISMLEMKDRSSINSKPIPKGKNLSSLMKEPNIKNVPQATPESIEYWRKKWGISDESLEETKEAI